MKLDLSPEPSVPCQVCTYQSDGYHFNVLTCRACASFFRRSIVSNIKYQCKNGRKFCKIDNSVRSFCRYCRFEKCVKAGMNSERIKKNCDPYSSTIHNNLTNCFTNKFLDEDESIINQIRDLFILFNPHKNSDGFNNLEKLTEGLKFIRRNQKMRNIKVIDGIDTETINKIQFKVIGSCATWLLFSSFFLNLQENEKFQILKGFWHGWSVLEFLSRSVEVFGNEVYDEKIVLISDNTAIQFGGAFQNCLKTLSPRITEYIKKKLELSFSLIFENLAHPLNHLKLTEKKISYILWQLVWSIAKKTVSGESLKKCEHYTNQLSNDLHEYYTRELKLDNYEFRIGKMVDIVQIIQQNFH